MLTRREFLQLTALLPLFACLPNPTLPNIILIMADDLALGDLGCYEQRLIATPNLDRLAANGLLFTQHHSAAPVCHPTRLSLFTGYRPRTTANPDTWLLPEERTFPEHMADYRTGMVGKWGLGGGGVGRMPWEVFGYSCSTMYTPFYAPSVLENGTEVAIPENLNGQQGRYVPDLLQEKSVEFIQGGGPFFLCYTPYLQHIAGDGGYPVPDGPYSATGWTETQRDFANTVARLDGYVGQIMDAAPANTLILFTSDNGGYVDEAYDFFDRGVGLRGGKKTMYQGGLNVPLLAYWPGVIAPGVSDHVSTTYDLGATVLEAAGLGASWGDGISLLPSFLGLNQPVHNHLYWAFSEAGVMSEAVRWGPWKAVRNGAGPVEMYDLGSDPGEAVDLAASEPGIAEWLRQLMAGYCVAGCQVWLPAVGK